MSPKRKVSLFPFLTLVFSSLSYVPIIRAGTANVQGGLFVLTMMWSPGLAAILTQLIATRSLHGLGWRLGPARWLGIAYILPIVYALPVYAFTWLTGLGSLLNPLAGYFSHPPDLAKFIPRFCLQIPLFHLHTRPKRFIFEDSIVHKQLNTFRLHFLTIDFYYSPWVFEGLVRHLKDWIIRLSLIFLFPTYMGIHLRRSWRRNSRQ